MSAHCLHFRLSLVLFETFLFAADATTTASVGGAIGAPIVATNEHHNTHIECEWSSNELGRYAFVVRG